MTTTRTYELKGLEASNPLAFLAALGVLRILDERHGSVARLGWRQGNGWRAIVEAPAESDLIELLWADLETWRVEEVPELQLAYETSKGVIRDLKPPPEHFRKYAEDARESAIRTGNRRWADYVAAYGAAHPNGSEPIGVDGKGNTKPTALHFTAGNQLFLGNMLIPLVQTLTREHLQEALYGPWRYESKLPVLGWDATGQRSYALMASDPSQDKKTGVPAADWLAFRGLPFFPTALRNENTVTTGFRGSGKRFTFRWPVWSAVTDANTVGSLLALPQIEQMTPAERKSRSIETVFLSRVLRTDQGGYGSFSPAALG